MEEVESSALGPEELRMRVRACGVNFPDVLMIRGQYQVTPNLPFAPGCEVAGEVLETGSEVSRFNVGDRIIAMPGVLCQAMRGGGECENGGHVAEDQCILAFPAVEDVIPGTAFEGILAVSTVEAVVPIAANQDVLAIAAGE